MLGGSRDVLIADYLCAVAGMDYTGTESWRNVTDSATDSGSAGHSQVSMLTPTPTLCVTLIGLYLHSLVFREEHQPLSGCQPTLGLCLGLPWRWSDLSSIAGPCIHCVFMLTPIDARATRSRLRVGDCEVAIPQVVEASQKFTDPSL